MAAVREGRWGPGGVWGGPSTVQTVTASSAQVRIVQATSRFRIRPNPSVI
jgi:hypothetical protein